MSNILEIRDLRIAFRLDRKSEPFEAVKGISFDIPTNSTVALVGESGSGKSVSAMSILGLLPDNAIIPAASTIRYGGRDLLKTTMRDLQSIRGKDISVIFQEPMTSLNPVFTVGEQIAEVLRLHMGMSPRAAAARTVELLTEVGIPNPALRVNSYPHEMSGGQQQRVMIAMAIACEPKLLIADEPTTALDVTIQAQILDLMRQLKQRVGTAILLITHDLGVIAEVSDRVCVMYAGNVVEVAPVRELYKRPLHPYTQGLLNSIPRMDEPDKKLESIPGSVP
ncbi:MAG TPA: ABC transporter ATP-binding protein, partial [Usitatibacter sp.]|nr:ABC transporter ATP-binding protein [Usitatibacter sp.]